MDSRTVPPPLGHLPLFATRGVSIIAPNNCNENELGAVDTTRARRNATFGLSTPPITKHSNDLTVRAEAKSRELSTPVEHGRDGASDAAKHLKDAAPAFVLTALGDALLAFAGKEFTSDDIRRAAGPTVEAWLTAEPERRNCFPGWWRARVRLHRLQRVVGKDAITRRGSRRGAHATVWRFPTPEGTTNG